MVMVTGRQESLQRKRALLVDLRAAIKRGQLRPDAKIPGLTSLARRYGLSKPTVLEALQPLINDGTLRVRPSVGIFVGQSRSAGGFYVLLVGSRRAAESWAFTHNVLHGFEDRVAALGASALVLEVDAFLGGASHDPASVLGVFAFNGGGLPDVLNRIDAATPVVHYLGGVGTDDLTDPRLSFVDLDNITGGEMAARQLLWAGLHDIAFLGLHRPHERQFPWSRQRAEGWEKVMRGHHPWADLVELTPHRGPAPGVAQDGPEAAADARVQVASIAADQARNFEACIGADDTVIVALAKEFEARGVPESERPVMVGFEGLASAMPHVLTSVRPRWGELGARAADMLFQATRGRRYPGGRLEIVPMSVVPRPARTVAGSRESPFRRTG
jgi:DNA-binding LacI/PurR family transcriptional regulator